MPSQKKRGRPRKDNDDPAEPQEERRRKQIRLAQRAYREREKGVLSQHEIRIAQLETSIKQMNRAISSFGEQLAKSRVLASHTNLQDQLLKTVATCKSIIEHSGLATEEGQLTPSTENDESPLSQAELGRISNPSPSVQLQGRQRYPSLISSPLVDISLQDFSSPLGHGSSLLFDNVTTTTMPTVDLSLFIRQLRIASMYHAFFSLRDSSQKLDDLRKKFRFLFSILSREDLTSYFEAGLVAKIHPERMLEWEELPFFHVGGAGSHFLQSSRSLYENKYPVREDPLSEFPSDIQDEMDGRWYDIKDLEGFIQERGVQLLADSPTVSRQGLTNPTAVSASGLIKGIFPSFIRGFKSDF
ncbi:uncharacterized protein N7511_008292 [Penicillium nucicola]|uniref:uncharacterized protein n=1 Tax=Penicillium nucicola TaxID=1850975 RepID=UPI002544FFF9|nr:uncharacterized protein N7511_008292 [Penicillium nucicola]KAJ5754139.1 hypothetical protein N7511_008292 [Penicillium nucicola]